MKSGYHNTGKNLVKNRAPKTNEFLFIGLTFPGLLDPAIAISASRAGGVGVLNLQGAQDEQAVMSAISRLAQYAKGDCGIRMDEGAEELIAGLIPKLPESIKVAILTYVDQDRLWRQTQNLHERDMRVLLEAKSLEQAMAGESAGVDGFIAKGNESGGWVGEQTTFILLQQLLAHTCLPVLAQGGVGLHTAAACYVAGAGGVVLDNQFSLTNESPLPSPVKAQIARMDGSETICVGNDLAIPFRAYARPGMSAIEELQKVALTISENIPFSSEACITWRQEVNSRIGWDGLGRRVWPLGQDAAFAEPLARQFGTVGGIIGAIRKAIDTHARAARSLKPLGPGTPLAESHNTFYPIVQGPMTRVSDTPRFAAEVAKSGALPFLALALMRADEVRSLIEDTHKALGDQPWGVGVLGFVPPELRQEQLEVILARRPPFALIAGARPDQALTLERAGIPTYLHVPSPQLLKLFIENGARRFVFEGRECGGHVGPRSSFVLWDLMIDVLLQSLTEPELANCHVLFAGGIHDAASSSMVAALAAPLAMSGAKIGVLLGTVYLFTREAVTSGAIVKGFQKEAISCRRTVLLESGPGHATRCANTPFVGVFEAQKRRLAANTKAPEQIRSALENLNIGRLRIASKGIVRHPDYGQDPAAPKFIELGAGRQSAEGMYMLGQLAALRSSTCSIEELHDEISVKGSELLAELPGQDLSQDALLKDEKPFDVAIIGMACMLPKAPNLQKYWENILHKVDAVGEIPERRWDWRRYYDPNPKARDKISSRWGGFLEETPIDPTRYGIPPATITSIEPAQLLTLDVVRAVLEDARYLDRQFPRRRTSVIFGAGSMADVGQKYIFRALLPMFIEGVDFDRLPLPEWTQSSYVGILPNIIAGRVANCFDLGGVNYTVDAACASSLAAVQLAIRELESGASDMVIVGAADTLQSPHTYMSFSKTGAFSPRGRCSAFDENADGIVISEGIAALILKRLEDAERDGDRIYAVIKAIAGSSDGREKGLAAPNPEGQALALNRAYAKAGLSPSSVSLIEAHGTGTVVGDCAEFLTLKRLFEADGAFPQKCAIGSVKSMIGHTKRASGLASLIKVALALHHKILPPTIHVETPNPKLGISESPFYLNTEARPWIGLTRGRPRRSGINAFGFGGTNFHAVLEEYKGGFLDSDFQSPFQDWPAELILLGGDSYEQLLKQVNVLEKILSNGANPPLRDLAYTLWLSTVPSSIHKLSIVAASIEELRQSLGQARAALEQPERAHVMEQKGIYLSHDPLRRSGKVAFLFPGQGSQYPGMLSDLAMYFPEARRHYELADLALDGKFPQPLSAYIFPPPSFSPTERRERERELTQTHIAQPALGASAMGLLDLLQRLGITAEIVAGHSYGEYVALCSAGVFSEETLYALSEARGRSIIESSGQDLGTMAAVMECPEKIENALNQMKGVWIANLNAPRQTVISGRREAVASAVEYLTSLGIQARPIQVACAFHSELIAGAQRRLAERLSEIEFNQPLLQVFSNSTASPYPGDPGAIAELLSKHLVSAVRFTEEIEAMYEAGARIFVEVGPRNALTNLIIQILEGRPHCAVALDAAGRPGIVQLLNAVGQLAAHGVPVNLDRLFSGRAAVRLDVDAPKDERQVEDLNSKIWLVDGGGVRTANKASKQRERDAEKYETQRQSLSVMEPAMNKTRKATEQIIPKPSLTLETGNQAINERETDQTNGVTGTTPLPYSDQSMNRGNSEVGAVMAEFQRLMSRFLETQQKVMMAYLQTSNAEATTAECSASPRVDDDLKWTVANQSPQPFAQPPTAPYTKPSSVLSADKVVDGRAKAEEALRSPGGADDSLSVRELQSPSEHENLVNALLGIVTERTGYPAEMLDLDVELEAELGIDSIKHVEILGILQQSLAPAYQRKAQERMERLVRTKTLRGILNILTESEKTGEASDKAEHPESRKHVAILDSINAEADVEINIPRFILKPVECALSGEPRQIVTDGVFLITDDGRGVAQALVEMLESRRIKAVLVCKGGSVVRVSDRVYKANMDELQGAAELLNVVRREEGHIAGLIHLLSLNEAEELDEMYLAEWQSHIQQEVKSFFYLAKAAASDLKRSASTQTGWLLAATPLGPLVTRDGDAKRSISVTSAGIAGLTKSLALEWPEVTCKTVHLNLMETAQTLAGQLIQEMAADDQTLEVAYRRGNRLIMRLEKAPAKKTSAANGIINSDSIILVTGGARGITAAVAIGLAEKYRPTLILIGRSPAPDSPESQETAGLVSPREIKAALMEKLRRTGQPVTPSRTEALYVRLLQDREMRNSLSAIKQAGAQIQYYQADVRDGVAFEQVINGVRLKYGRLDGIIHGAGVIEDKLVEDKTSDSFDRVFDTKVTGAFILAHALRADTKFLVFFSSVAGCFGSRGQADYSAANEVLNKLAVYLESKWPGRVISINWGPWEGAGMLSDEARRQFIERGIRMIKPEVGKRALEKELIHGREGEVEVVLGGGPWG